MSLYRELSDQLPYNPAERSGVLGARRAEAPWILRASAGGGLFVALLLVTGGGILPRNDVGAALFWGLVAAIAIRGSLLAWLALRGGAWQAWRARPVNGEACDRASGGLGIALALILASGAGGIGPAVSPITAVMAGLFAGLGARAILGWARWP